MSDIPWTDRRDVNIGSNEFVNQFTLNRNLNRLLDNDLHLKDYIDDLIGTQVSDILDGATIDTEYVSVTSYNSDQSLLSKSFASTTDEATSQDYIFNIDLFGGDFTPSKIRQLHVVCDITTTGNTTHGVMHVSYPDNSTNSNKLVFGDDSYTSTRNNIIVIPINNDQSNVKITISFPSVSHTSISTINFEIIGVTQQTITTT